MRLERFRHVVFMLIPFYYSSNTFSVIKKRVFLTQKALFTIFFREACSILVRESRKSYIAVKFLAFAIRFVFIYVWTALLWAASFESVPNIIIVPYITI